jgi:hypothetical protein
MNFDIVKCPHCDGEHTHHINVSTVFRTKEDGEGTQTDVSRKEVKTRHVKAEDIPGRRDCFSVTFICEDCGKASSAWFIQDRGQTLVEWREPSISDKEAYECLFTL